MKEKNYGSLLTDKKSGLPYITDVATGKRLFKHPPCRICGMTPWWFTAEPKNTGGTCAPERRERNDNT